METFVGDTIKVVLKTNIDLSGYIDLRMRFRRPDGTTGEWIATVSGTNNTWMEYTTVYADLNLPGIWAIEALAVDVANAITLHGKCVEFEVLMPIRMIYVSPFGASASTFSGSLTPSGP